MRAINRGFFVSAVISAAAAFVISGVYMDSYKPARRGLDRPGAGEP